MTARCKKYDLSFGFSDFLCFFRLSSDIYLPRHLVWRALCHSVCLLLRKVGLLSCTDFWLVLSHVPEMAHLPAKNSMLWHQFTWKHPQWKFQLYIYIYSLRERRPFCSMNSLNSDQELDWSWAIGPLLNWPLSNLLSRSPQIHQQNCGLDLWIIPRLRLGIMFILKIKTSEKTKSQIVFLTFLPDAFCSCVFCISSLNVFAISLGVISSSIPKLLRHLMCSQKMRTGDDACDARPRLISSRTMRPGDGMKHCLVRKQEPSEFNSAGRKTLGIPASSLQASQRIHAYQPGGRAGPEGRPVIMTWMASQWNLGAKDFYP